MTGSKSGSSRVLSRSPRTWGLVALAALLTINTLDSPAQRWLRFQTFDAYQRLMPRERVSNPAIVVEIDEHSLAAYGQWPWPRTRLAEIIERITPNSPAAIGLDIFMPEPDRLSPRRIAQAVAGLDPEVVRRLEALPDNDARLAAAMRDQPVVLGFAALAADSLLPDNRPPPAPPIRVYGPSGGMAALTHFPGALRGLPEIESAAAGHGVMNVVLEAGVVRRMPLLAWVQDALMPAFAVELLRIAAAIPVLEAVAAESGMTALRIGDLELPTDSQGLVWPRYGMFDGRRYVSAYDLLEGRTDGAVFERKLVLVAMTGLGLMDWQPTPTGERVPGIEIHMQLLENIFDGSWLRRPDWAIWAENGGLLLVSLTLGLTVPWLSPSRAFAVFGALLAALGAGGMVAFQSGLLLDAATPAASSALVFAILLGATLTESQRQRRELAQRLQAEREAALRMAGELDAARRVQLGMLPETPGVLAGDRRVDIKAFMESARVVGGDLYDFFLLDGRKLFVMIGDVSGKGLPAAMYMALVKALCKNAMLRGHESLDLAMTELEVELARENPEMLFVSLLALTLDLETGEMTYCNAGHEPPYTLLPGRPAQRLEYKGGPPLCVLEGYAYPLATYQLSPGETLCLITDGITEAGDSSGNLYGRGRLESLLNALAVTDPDKVIELLKKDVAYFSAGAEPADDQTALVLRWNG